MKNIIIAVTMMTLIMNFPQSAYSRSYVTDDDIYMLGRRARVVTVTGDQSSPTDTAQDTEQQAASLTASTDGFRIVDVESTDGRQGHRGIYVGDTLVQRHPPNCFDESSVKSWKNNAGEIVAITYKDNSNHRVNGFVTDIPVEASITKVIEEGSNVRVVWKDGEEMKSLVVKSLKNRGDVPGTSAITSSVYEDDNKTDGEDTSNNTSNNGSGSSTTDGSENTSTDGNNNGGTKEDSETKSDNGDKKDENKGTKSGSTTPPPVKDAIPEPGNSYGFDSILDDATIQAIVSEESGKIRGKFNKDGLALNDWGVAIGKTSSCTITHVGGVDGYQSSTHYWLSQPAVRSAIEKAASTTRSELEAERDKRYELAVAQWRGNQGNSGGSSQEGPASTSNDRPGSTVSAGSSVPQGSNYMSGS